MRLRFWRTRDEKIARLLERLREAQQRAAHARLGNRELARANATLTYTDATNQRLRQDAERQRDAARAELELLRPVVEHAQALMGAIDSNEPSIQFAAMRSLAAAVDALPKVPTQRDGSES